MLWGKQEKNLDFILASAMVFALLLPWQNSLARLTCTGAHPAQETSIMGTGGRLENVTVQDQDGIATCYANSLAYALQARLGFEVSANQLALATGMQSAQSGSSGRIQAVTGRASGSGRGEVLSTFVDNNSSCGAFNAMQARGGHVCPRQDLESTLHLTNNSAEDQGRVIKSLSNLYDRFSALKTTNATVAGQFRQAITDLLQAGRANALEDCRRQQREGVTPALNDRILDKCKDAYGRMQTSMRTLASKRTQLAAVPTGAEGQEARQTLEQEIAALEQTITISRAKINQIGTIGRDPTLSGTMTGSGSQIDCTMKSSVVSALRQHYVRPLAQAMATSSGEFNPNGSIMNVLYGALDHIFTPIPGEVPTHTNGSVFPDSIVAGFTRARARENNLRSEFMPDIRVVVPSYCSEDASYLNLKDPNKIRLYIHEHYQFCPTTEFGNAAAEAFSRAGVLRTDNLPITDILSAVADLDKRADDYIMGVIGPQCANITENRLEGMSCRDTILPVRLTDAEREGKTPAEIYALKKRKSQRKMAQLAEDNLSKGNPLMLAVCTNFLKNTRADSHFRERCNAAGPHGRHIITAVGYRCRNNKIEYQLLNSWGPGCDSYRPTTPADAEPLYNCDENTGTIWVPEDVLVRNTQGISAINPPPATFGPNNPSP